MPISPPTPARAAAPASRVAPWEWWIGGAICLLPLAPLVELGANFYYDWHNHQWLVGYFGEYFRTHGRLPDVLNLAGAVAMPQPVFYGFLLYPCLGLGSALLGAAMALRVGVALTLALQFCAIHLAGRRLLGHRGVSLAIAASVTWSVHGLTNLYNRAALTEFFAVAFLHTAIACGLLALAPGGSRRGRRAAAGWALGMAVLVVGAHPPTALLSLGLLALIVPWGWQVWRRAAPAERLGLAGLGVALLLGAVMVAPWVYANLHFRGQLGITGKYREFSYSVRHIDAVAARFSPVPPDVFFAEQTRPGETPFIEAPLAMALLLLAGWHLAIAWRARADRREEATGPERAAAWLAVLAAVWFALTLLLSLSPVVGSGFRFLAPYVQFATRFVSHANLGLLILVLATGMLAARAGGYGRFRRGTGFVVAVVLGLGLLAIAIKLRHAVSVREPGGEPQYAWRGGRAALVTAGKADAAGDYAVLKRWPQLVPKVAAAARSVEVPVGTTGAEFGETGAVEFSLEAPGWVVSNIVAFPWSRVRIDGEEVPDEWRAAAGFRQAFRLPAGRHTLRWNWEPDALWRWLNGLSRVGLAAGWLLVVILTVRAVGGSRETALAPPAAR